MRIRHFQNRSDHLFGRDQKTPPEGNTFPGFRAACLLHRLNIFINTQLLKFGGFLLDTLYQFQPEFF